MIGILVALPIEAKFLNSWLKKSKNKSKNKFIIKTTGVNPKKTQEATKQLIEKGVTSLISWGTAGSIEQNLESGNIIIPEYIQTFSTVIKTSTELNKKIYDLIKNKDIISQGNIVHTEIIIDSIQQKKLLSNEFDNAVAIDMESFIIADLARRNNIPFSAIRIIVDTFDMALPRCISQSINKRGKLSYVNLIKNLAKDKDQITDLRLLSNSYKIAKPILNETASVIISHES